MTMQEQTYDFSHWGGKLPKVSCICITYGRPHLIGEAIESFLRQDYAGEKELIILNDHPEILLELTNEHADVILVNHPERYPNIGAKRNAATTLSSGDILFPWDDDDISLPWRISTTVEKMTNLSYFKPTNLWWWDGKDVEYKQGVMAHAMSAYSRKLFDEVGGYPDFNSGEDQEFEAKIAALHLHETSELNSNEVFYIYRMIGTDTYHLSYYGYNQGLEECQKYILEKDLIGKFSIKSEWLNEYAHMAVKKCSDIALQQQPSTQGLSICFSLKNRSSIPHGNRRLELFPNCIKSIAKAATNPHAGELEIVVADYNSEDWPLTEWLEQMAGNVAVQIIQMDGNFSKGRAQNAAALSATHDNLLLCDADATLDAEAIITGMQQLASGHAFFPVIQYLDEQGNPSFWGYDGFGIAFVTKTMFSDVRGIPEFESWGGEDNIFYQSISSTHPVSRHECEGIKHQWHPESCRHENYSRPMREDYTVYTSTPEGSNIYHSEQIGKKHEDFRIFHGRHPQWSGPLHFHEDGRLVRPGVDTGNFELHEESSILLKWDRWDTEKLDWDQESGRYRNKETNFTLIELQPSEESADQTTIQADPEEKDTVIHAYTYEGLCNRINCMASALATGRKVILHWSVNLHCPVKFENLFNSIPGITVFNEENASYDYAASPDHLCWFYPRNVTNMPTQIFYTKMLQSYKIILNSLKSGKYAVPPDDSLALYFRHHLPETDNLEHFLNCAKDVIDQLKPSAVHVASDDQSVKDTILKMVTSQGITATENPCPLLNSDLDRSCENIKGLCKDLSSMSHCHLGILSSSTRSTVTDALRAHGIKIYHTFHDPIHRKKEWDDLFELHYFQDALRPIHAYAYEGLCNRINIIASALTTGRPVKLHWVINEHCPAKFEEIFSSIPGIDIINETAKHYDYVTSPEHLCWFYPKNIDGFHPDFFRKRMLTNYQCVLKALKVKHYAVPDKNSLALYFRHHLPESDSIKHFLECVQEVIDSTSPSAIHVTCDYAPYKEQIIDFIAAQKIPISKNTYPLLQSDLDRSIDNITGLCKDLLSMSNCQIGILSNNTRSTIPDSLRAFGVTSYHTYNDTVHRTSERDDLLDLHHYKEMCTQQSVSTF